VNPEDPVQIMQVNALSAQLNSPGGDSGVFAEATVLKEGLEILKVANMLQHMPKHTTCRFQRNWVETNPLRNRNQLLLNSKL